MKHRLSDRNRHRIVAPGNGTMADFSDDGTKVTQISVFLENKKGRLFEVCHLLGRAQVNIRALNISETADYGVLRLIVDRPFEAFNVLRENNIVASHTDVVLVEVGDRPGGLASILRVINASEVNLEYMYGFFERLPDKAMLVFHFDRPDEAIQMLRRNRIRICSLADLSEAVVS
jgi:hypothetical protein